MALINLTKLNITVEAGAKAMASTFNAVARKVDDIIDYFKDKTDSLSDSVQVISGMINGGTITKSLQGEVLNIEGYSGNYINANSGATAVLDGSGAHFKTVWFPISKGMNITVHVPKTPNSASMILAYTNQACSRINDGNNVVAILTPGTSNELTYTITSALDYDYLLVVYNYDYDIPTAVVSNYPAEPTVVVTTSKEYSSSAKEQARTNIGAASSSQVNTIGGTLTSVQTTVNAVKAKVQGGLVTKSLICTKLELDGYTGNYISTNENYGIAVTNSYNFTTKWVAIKQGMKITVNIAKAPNSASYILAYTNSDIGRISSDNMVKLTDYVGDSKSGTYTINSALDYKYLLVCSDDDGGATTVTAEVEGSPVVLRSDIEYTEEEQAEFRDVIGVVNYNPEPLKVLLIGSSHGVNTIHDFPILAHHSGVPVVVGNIYQGGQTIANYATQFADDVYIPYAGVYAKNTNGAWTSRQSLGQLKIKDVLADEKWDVICLMTAASEDTTWTDEQNTALDTMISYITSKCDWSPKIVFNSGMTDANNRSDVDAMWTRCQTIKNNFGIEILPTVKVVEMLRQNSTLAALGTSSAHLLTCDGQHLDQGVGMYATGCMCFEFFLKHINKSCVACKYIPQRADIASYWYNASYFTETTNDVSKLIKRLVSAWFLNN